MIWKEKKELLKPYAGWFVSYDEKQGKDAVQLACCCFLEGRWVVAISPKGVLYKRRNMILLNCKIVEVKDFVFTHFALISA